MGGESDSVILQRQTNDETKKYNAYTEAVTAQKDKIAKQNTENKFKAAKKQELLDRSELRFGVGDVGQGVVEAYLGLKSDQNIFSDTVAAQISTQFDATADTRAEIKAVDDAIAADRPLASYEDYTQYGSIDPLTAEQKLVKDNAAAATAAAKATAAEKKRQYDFDHRAGR